MSWWHVSNDRIPRIYWWLLQLLGLLTVTSNWGGHSNSTCLYSCHHGIWYGKITEKKEGATRLLFRDIARNRIIERQSYRNT